MRGIWLAALLLFPGAPAQAASTPAAPSPPSIHVTVFFQGLPVRCLVDTGATVSLLDRTAANRIPSAFWPGVALDVTLGGRVSPAQWAWVADVGTTDIGFGGAWVVAMDSAESVCLLGADVLARHGAVVLDFGQQRVYAHRG